MVSLTVYDGAYGIGGNKLYLEEDGKGVFLDFGKNFGKYGFFYEEFLKNRETRDIHDLMYLDLLPKLNIYRPDLISGDLSLSYHGLALQFRMRPNFYGREECIQIDMENRSHNASKTKTHPG